MLPHDRSDFRVRVCRQSRVRAPELQYWRPVPGFAPTEAIFAASRQQMDELHAELSEAVRLGQLHPDAASVEALRLYTVVLSGVISQQMANQPGADYDTGIFTSLHIDAPPDVVYALVADVTRTPELSPEVQRCTWLDGATGPAVGARFEAGNKATRGPAWKNRPVVTAASPGREFASPAPNASPAPSSGATSSSPTAPVPA